MMRKMFAAFAALTLIASCATTYNAADYAPGDEPALFAVRDADSTMYLFGTVHVRPEGSSWGGPSSEAALNEAEEVWTEIEISPDAELAVQIQVLQQGMAPRNRPLSSWLTDEENARLDATLTRLNINRAMVEPMKPWLAALTLSVLPIIQAGYDPQAGVDRSIDAIADAAGKTRRALETGEQQIGFLAGFSEDVQRQMLLDAIDEADGGVEQIEAMSDVWERGDLRPLEVYVIDEMRAEYPELYNVMFKQRNDAWMEILTREMDGAGTDFVAVGAGHLLGSDGLVAQFRARGYNVERVRRE